MALNYRYKMRSSGFVAIIMLLTISACSQSGRVENSSYDFLLKTLLKHSVNEMDVANVDNLSDAVHFADARALEEYQVSHIEEAVWVGYDDFDLKRLEAIPKEDTVIVYCSIGYRSEKVAEQLEAAGYRHVWNLYGGIFEWKNQDHEVLDSEGKVSEKVHAFDKNWGRWLTEGEKVY